MSLSRYSCMIQNKQHYHPWQFSTKQPKSTTASTETALRKLELHHKSYTINLQLQRAPLPPQKQLTHV